jgi:2,3-diketo-5-methylthio-1-phosphopentane phosphatase
MAGWKILCDFDGTIVANDVTDHLLERFADSAWRDLERDWEQGRIGARECMQGQIALLQAAPAVLDDAVAAMAVDPGFPGFVALARRFDLPLTVVSDGLDRVIQAVLQRTKLGDIGTKSSRFEHLGGGHWRLDFPYAAEACVSAACTCKCEIARGDGQHTLLIGDGRSDFCVADMADFVFAKDKLLAYCRERGIPHAAFQDFTEAQSLLARFVARLTPPASERVAHG